MWHESITASLWGVNLTPVTRNDNLVDRVVLTFKVESVDSELAYALPGGQELLQLLQDGELKTARVTKRDAKYQLRITTPEGEVRELQNAEVESITVRGRKASEEEQDVAMVLVVGAPRPREQGLADWLADRLRLQVNIQLDKAQLSLIEEAPAVSETPQRRRPKPAPNALQEQTT